MHFMVDELQQEPRDISQDKCSDEVPVNHVPQTADAPVGPGQGSAGTGCTWAQSSVGAGGRGQLASCVSWACPPCQPLLRQGRDSAWGEGRVAPGTKFPLVVTTVGSSRAGSLFASCMPTSGQCPGTSPSPFCPLAPGTPERS